VLSLAPIRAFAQDGDSIAWCSYGVIYVGRVSEPGRIWAVRGDCGPALALANRRALWDGPGAPANTVGNVELLTATPGSAAVTVGDLPPYTRFDLQHVADASQRPTDEEYDRYLWLVEEAKRASYDAGLLRQTGSFQVGDVLSTAIFACASDLAVGRLPYWPEGMMLRAVLL